MRKINKTKMLVALILILAITVGSIFASPLNLASSVGNAKIYNHEYKTTNNSNTIDEGWVVRTADNEVSFEKEGLQLTIGENSLAQIISLDEKAPVIYLLDGWLSAKTAEGVNLTVNTTVTSYAVTANSEIIVISNSSTENGYVNAGTAAVTNNITGASNSIEAGKYLDLSQSAAQPQAPAEDSEVAAIVAKAEQPVEQPEAEPEQPAVEQPAEPEVETTTEVVAQQPAETTTEVVAQQPVEATTEVVAQQPAETTTEVVAQQPAEATTEVTVETKVLEPLKKTFTYAGYEATITAYVGTAIVEYPAFVTAQEIYTAAAAAYNAYSQYLNDVYIEVVEDGKAVVTYPEVYGPEEFNFAVSLLEKELPYYIASLFVEDKTKIATDAEVNVDFTEPVIIEIVAQEDKPKEASAEPVTETQETTTETETEAVVEVPAEPVAPVTEAPIVKAEKKEQKEKTSTFKIGATLGVLYGQYKEDSNFVIIKKTILGTSPKNLIVNVDPYITIGKFTLGLHASIDINDIKGSFTFNTNKGTTGYINSVAQYIGKISFNSDLLKINVDRTQEIDFSNPVFFTADKNFDKSNNLIATGSVEFGFLKISGFFDDLQLTSHLNGKAQFAGLSLTAGSQVVTVNTTVLAEIQSRSELKFYPAIDATATVNINKVKVEFYAGFASIYKLNAHLSKNFLSEGKVTVSTKAFSYGLGVAYNKGLRLNDLVSSTTVLPVTNSFEGDSLDVLLSAGLHWGVFSFDGEMSIPLSLKENGSHLVYNTVQATNGTLDITADLMSFTAKLDFNYVVISGGVLYQGFCGKLVKVAKAVKHNDDIKKALNDLIDTDLANIYAKLDIKFGTFDIYARADLAKIVDYDRLAATFGASFTF